MILNEKDISTVIETYFKNKPVNKVWLVGSYARGEADEGSDLDVLVDVKKDANLGLQFFTWPAELGELINKKVDVLSYGWVNKRIWPYIQKEMTLIYEK